MENLFHKNIHELLPHRSPFLFIDAVVDVHPGRVVASKQFKKDEEYFKGHFPGAPLVPGVLIVESMAQAGGLACALSVSQNADDCSHETLGREPQRYFLSRICDIKFKHPVFPGETLIVTAEIVQSFDPFFKVGVYGEVQGRRVAEGELVLTRHETSAQTR